MQSMKLSSCMVILFLVTSSSSAPVPSDERLMLFPATIMQTRNAVRLLRGKFQTSTLSRVMKVYRPTLTKTISSQGSIELDSPLLPNSPENKLGHLNRWIRLDFLAHRKRTKGSKVPTKPHYSKQSPINTVSPSGSAQLYHKSNVGTWFAGWTTRWHTTVPAGHSFRAVLLWTHCAGRVILQVKYWAYHQGHAGRRPEGKCPSSVERSRYVARHFCRSGNFVHMPWQGNNKFARVPPQTTHRFYLLRKAVFCGCEQFIVESG